MRQLYETGHTSDRGAGAGMREVMWEVHVLRQIRHENIVRLCDIVECVAPPDHRRSHHLPSSTTKRSSANITDEAIIITLLVIFITELPHPLSPSPTCLPCRHRQHRPYHPLASLSAASSTSSH